MRTDSFVLEPLGPQHNEDDYAAWSTSIEHIRSTPEFRADQASLDGELEHAVRAWVTGPDWGFTSVRFPGRD